MLSQVCLKGFQHSQKYLFWLISHDYCSLHGVSITQDLSLGKFVFGVVLLGSLVTHELAAQRRVKLEKADSLQGGVLNGRRYDSFVGNVLFSHQDALIYCDSAVFYRRDNSLQAFGNVKIDDQDSVVVTSQRLIYNGDSRIAQLRNNVIFRKRDQMTLYTDNLDYDRGTELATYFGGGRIVDSTNELSSEKGYYAVRASMASFKSNVVGKNKDYTLASDTLQYNTRSKIIYFRDRTELTDVEGNIFVHDGGEYDTRIERSDFIRGYMESESYFIYGDELAFDDIRKLYTARKNVKMVAKNDDVIVLGEAADYRKLEETAKVYESPLAKLISEGDTLYVAADTLVSLDSDSVENKRLQAYKDVRLFKSNLKGIADSVVYFRADSMIVLYGDPVLWTLGNQMSADSIKIEIRNRTISKLYLVSNAFVASEDSLGNFNQIKGRDMEAIFRNNELDEVYVEGNGESIFFMLDENDSSMIGMNKILCSSMRLKFIENELEEVTFYTNNEGSFIPPHELTAPDTRLKGFTWRIEEEPKIREVVPEKHLPPRAALRC